MFSLCLALILSYQLGLHFHINMSTSSSQLPRPSTPPGLPPLSAYRPHFSKLSFGVVCSSNINRSMEAHVVLNNAGLRCESYGTGTQVRLPGRTAMEPRVFRFGTPYAHMYANLAATLEDEAYFRRNGVLQLCRRGAAVKKAPNRWQDTLTDNLVQHDVVVAFEERIFDAVVEDLQLREPTQEFKPIHVICLDTKDNPHEAAVQGQVALDLCWRLEQYAKSKLDESASTAKEENASLLVSRVAEIIDEFQQERSQVTPIKILYQICYL